MPTLPSDLRLPTPIQAFAKVSDNGERRSLRLYKRLVGGYGRLGLLLLEGGHYLGAEEF